VDDRLLNPGRLKVLSELSILDTSTEPEYDEIAKLAAICCRSPIAAINFVGADRHWTKAYVGIQEQQGSSVAESVSFCAATVRSENAVLTISDTKLSEAWRSNPAVLGGPRLRFYAGATIFVLGEPVGVLCVADDKPREFSEAEQHALVALSHQLTAQLELRRRNAELRELAVNDPLTGLANRGLLLDRLNLAIEQHRRSGGNVGVLFCDVDDFKQINDRFGHHVGDEVLCHVADRLSAVARATDTVSRFAGDEFVVLCPGLTASGDLEFAAQRLSRSMATPYVRGGEVLTPRVSIGAALLMQDESAASVLRRADEAMYQAKARQKRG
jgi:diguanylate cyclase (GGDEF)-like protein